MNQFYRHNSLFPHALVSLCLFFGNNDCGPQWAFERKLPSKITWWDADWGTDIESVGACPTEIWSTEKQIDAASEEEM